MTDQKCPKCGRQLQVYYGEYCARCDKPEFEEIRTLNLLRALYHIVALDGDDPDDKGNFKNRFWDYLCQHPFSNDSYMIYWFGSVEEPNGYSPQQVADEKRFMEVFGLTEPSCIFEVSW
jgi:hypothetical protein